MHQPNDEQLDHFFQRLNKPLLRMPQPARAELHQELRQHLDALAAAYEELGSSAEEAFELALRQFGDPGKVGRRLWWEWFLCSRPRPSEDFRAVLYTLGMYAASTPVLFSILFVILFVILPLSIAALRSPAAGDDFLNGHSGVLSFLLVAGIPSLAGLLTGRKHGPRAVRATFWASMSLFAFLTPIIAGASLLLRQDFPPNFLAGFGFMTLCGCLSAYVTSARTRRTRLSLADFALRRTP